MEISTCGRSQRDYDKHIHEKCIDNVVYWIRVLFGLDLSHRLESGGSSVLWTLNTPPTEQIFWDSDKSFDTGCLCVSGSWRTGLYTASLILTEGLRSACTYKLAAGANINKRCKVCHQEPIHQGQLTGVGNPELWGQQSSRVFCPAVTKATTAVSQYLVHEHNFWSMKCIVGYLTVHTSDAYSTKWVEQVHICALEVHLKCSTWELSFGKYLVGDISQVCKNTSIQKLIEKHHLKTGWKLLFTWQERKPCWTLALVGADSQPCGACRTWLDRWGEARCHPGTNYRYTRCLWSHGLW